MIPEQVKTRAVQIRYNRLQSRLEDVLVRYPVPGASVAVLRGSELTAAAAGVTNVTTGVPVTADTVTHIGSITKVFTTTLVMQLVDEGKIDLDKRVVHYLPDLELKNRDALEQLTVRMLLNHTSGIDGVMLPDYGHDEETIEKGIRRFAELEQIHAPGVECSYNNAGMVIAGYLAQRLRGKGWYALIRERILAPLGLQHAATAPEEALLHRAAVGHYVDPGSKRPYRTSTAFLPMSFAPAGTTLMTSASDLIGFARAHMALGVGVNGVRILSARSAQAMQQITVDNSGKGYTYMDVGLGWMISKDGLLYHVGGSPGILSALYVHPQRQFAAAMQTNADYGSSFELINEFMQPWLAEIGAIPPSGVADLRSHAEPVVGQPQKYVGVYEDIAYRFSVTRIAEGLALSKQAKYQHYESMPTVATTPRRLIPLGGEKYLLESDGMENLGMPDAFRVFSFRNSQADGRMQHLGNFMHLYRRVS